jgi:peptidyl-prolyl cis-trans isomerase A (cyclophilin A)
MFFSARLSKFTAAACFALSASFMAAQPASATIVRFQMVNGYFSVNLYDKTTPKTVENFLAYVRAGAYTNTFIHRSDPGFVVQGGGFKYPWAPIPQNAVVVNEPVYANKRGTIAMAKGKDVNSATNQWFFNLEDNSAHLDANTGGFTVFGQVIDTDMWIIDEIARLKIINYGGVPLNELPVRNYVANTEVTDKQLVMILGIVVSDENIDTAANLTPAKSTYSPSSSSSSSSSSEISNSSGGGSMGLLSLLMLGGLAAMSRSRR